MKMKTEILEVVSKFSERIAKLPDDLQGVFFDDLKTAVENRLKVLEGAKT
jgi:hypothetical protein